MKNSFKFEIPLFTDEKCDKLYQIIINFNQQILNLIKQNEELKQALEEIREIVLENPWEETDNWIKEKILKALESEK